MPDEKKPSQDRTVIRARAFLKAYRVTCSVTKSAQIAGINSRRHYTWLEKYPAYRRAFERAKIQAAEALEDKVKEGAFDGWLEPIFYQGVACGAVRRFDLGGRQMLLRGAMPEKYRERIDTRIEGNLEIIERLAAGRKRVAEARAKTSAAPAVRE
jgi:hypothetical protein